MTVTPIESGRKAAFLDRDGVINRDSGYVHRPEDFEFLPGVVEALIALRRAGFLLVVVTNQSGIGRGLYSEDAYQALTHFYRARLAEFGCPVDAVLHCPHAPEVGVEPGCQCRKPAPGMILKAAEDLGINLASSIMIGDKASDIAAGRAAGVARCYLVSEQAVSDDKSDGVFPSLPALVGDIVA